MSPYIKFTTRLILFLSAFFVVLPGMAGPDGSSPVPGHALPVSGTLTGGETDSPPTATLQGTITDGCTGLPVCGAVVTVATSATMTNPAGFYSMTTTVGAQNVMVSKVGYETYTANVTLNVGSVVTLDLGLFCAAVPPGIVTAALDNPASPTAVNISWTAPQGDYQLTYDDGSKEGFTVWAEAGNMNALRFTPLGYPVTINGGTVYIGTPADYPPNALPLTSFMMLAAKADGPGVTPGTWLDSVEITPTGYGWVSFSFPTPVTINSGEFFLVMKQGGIPPHACGIGIDLTTTQLRSWSRYITGGSSWMPAPGNFMMRALVHGPGGPVLLDNPGMTPTYQAWRLLQGQENTPASWVPVWSGSTTNCTDNSWTTLPPGPYKWATKAVYPPGQRLSAPAFSNTIGNNWTSTVTVQVVSDCDSCVKNAVVHLMNVSIPDTFYNIQTNATGYGQLSGVWNGNYTVSYARFGCITYTQSVTIMQNVSYTLNVSVPKPPVTNLSVNEQTLLATWKAPGFGGQLLDEKWSTGTFTYNQWTVTGGNWQISNTIGNPAPSGIFNWTPQCTNCSQYLTSRTLNGGGAPSVKLKYDITLNNYGTTNMNMLAVELWNGTTWSVLRNYSNLNGSIPWTTEDLDITNLAGGDFRIRFHTSSVDTYDINYWAVDNIRVYTESKPNCLLGYNVYINNTLSLFTYDTSYLIPPNMVVYGQPFQLCVKSVYTSGFSNPVCTTFTSRFLYPPKNLAVTPLECNAHLEWQKPDNPTAQSALTGYNIFRNSGLIHHNPHPDSLAYDDQGLAPGSYLYSVAATYNLGVYGFPGQLGQSLPLPDTGYVTVHCGMPMPFHENFQQGTFSFNNWTFEPEQGNWGISNGLKSVAPFADFHWNPVRTNYSYAMVSRYIDAYYWRCASIWLDLDYKLVDHNSTGNEKLKIDAWYGGSWHTLKTLSNTGSVDWTTLHLDLSAAAGKTLKIRFVASGTNSGDILHWYVDNISVYGICNAPLSPVASGTGHTATVSWNSPSCLGSSAPAGYNVYRTGPNGLPPFAKRNPSLVAGTAFQDNIQPDATYYYCITAVSIDSTLLETLCESPGSDTIVLSTVAIGEKPFAEPKVYPNPASGTVTVQADGDILALEVLNFRGQRVFSMKEPVPGPLKLDISAWPRGVYLFRITDRRMTKTVKVVRW